MCRLGGEKPPRLLKYSTWGLRLNVCTGKSMVAVNTPPIWLSEARRGEQGRTEAGETPAHLHTGHITYSSKLIPTSILLSHFIFTRRNYVAVYQGHDLCVAVFEWSVKDCRAG